jgi:hypothetical protein
MPVEDVPAKRWTCAGCGRSVLLEADEKPEGYHGLMELITRKGETGGDVYACRKGCIHKAVLAVTGDNGKDEEEPEEEESGTVGEAQEALGAR